MTDSNNAKSFKEVFYDDLYWDVEALEPEVLKFMIEESQKSLSGMIESYDIVDKKCQWITTGATGLAVYMVPIFIKDYKGGNIDSFFPAFLILATVISYFLNVANFISGLSKKEFAGLGTPPEDFLQQDGLYIKLGHKAILLSQIYSYQERIEKMFHIVRNMFVHYYYSITTLGATIILFVLYLIFTNSNITT